MTSPKNHDKQEDENLPATSLRDKTKNAFHYVYKHHHQEYDCFLKAGDDTYMIMENLVQINQDQWPVCNPDSMSGNIDTKIDSRPHF